MRGKRLAVGQTGTPPVKFTLKAAGRVRVKGIKIKAVLAGMATDIVGSVLVRIVEGVVLVLIAKRTLSILRDLPSMIDPWMAR